MRAVKIALGLCLLHTTLVMAATAPVAGTASIVAGAVSAVGLGGETRLLKKDDAVYSGDRIVTGSAGYVRLGFLDGGAMVLRPNTEFAIEDFGFQPGVVESTVKVVPPPPKVEPSPSAKAEPAPLQVTTQAATGNRAFFRLVRGGFRAVSGLVGKINREEYAVRVPVATIGIRGTVFFGVYCDAVCAADPLVQASLPAGESALGGMVSGVDQGSISVVSNAGQTAVVESSKFVLTTAAGTHISLPALPGFLVSEGWLQAAQQAAAAPQAPAPAPTAAAPAAAGSTPGTLANAGLSTVPAVGGIAAAVAATAAALAFDGDEGGNNSSPATATSPTSTR